MPMKIKHWTGFSATNDEKARLHQTEHPSALPASWRCPGQPSVVLEFFTLATRFAFGEGCDHSSYVGFRIGKNETPRQESVTSR
jgi:hypothetical protein